MTTLETPRLLLEEAKLKDRAFFYDLMNSPGWIEFIGDRGIKSMKDAERYIRNSLILSYRENDFGLYKMVRKNDRVPLGICGLLKRAYLDDEDLGFAILPQYQGMGYVSEAACAVIDLTFTKMNRKVLLAITTPTNIKSQKLLMKMGFTQTGKLPPQKQSPEMLLFSIQNKLQQ